MFRFFIVLVKGEGSRGKDRFWALLMTESWRYLGFGGGGGCKRDSQGSSGRSSHQRDRRQVGSEQTACIGMDGNPTPPLPAPIGSGDPGGSEMEGTLKVRHSEGG